MISKVLFFTTLFSVIGCDLVKKSADESAEESAENITQVETLVDENLSDKSFVDDNNVAVEGIQSLIAEGLALISSNFDENSNSDSASLRLLEEELKVPFEIELEENVGKTTGLIKGENKRTCTELDGDSEGQVLIEISRFHSLQRSFKKSKREISINLESAKTNKRIHKKEDAILTCNENKDHLKFPEDITGLVSTTNIDRHKNKLIKISNLKNKKSREVSRASAVKGERKVKWLKREVTDTQITVEREMSTNIVRKIHGEYIDRKIGDNTDPRDDFKKLIGRFQKFKKKFKGQNKPLVDLLKKGDEQLAKQEELILENDDTETTSTKLSLQESEEGNPIPRNKIIDLEITNKSKEGSPLIVEVIREKDSKKWTKRTIKSGVLQAIKKDKSLIETEFSNVVYDRKYSCTPISGTIKGKIYTTEADKDPKEYSITYEDGFATITFNDKTTFELDVLDCDLDL